MYWTPLEHAIFQSIWASEELKNDLAKPCLATEGQEMAVLLQGHAAGLW